jgi:hypothetical protein
VTEGTEALPVAVEKTEIAKGEVQGTAHVLKLGSVSFPCVEHLPMGTYLKHATAEVTSLEMYHHLLLKMVKPLDGDFEPVWDACDELEPREVIQAIEDLLGSYSPGSPT